MTAGRWPCCSGNSTILYLAFASGQPSPLPELPIQYAEFAAWQRQWLQGEQPCLAVTGSSSLPALPLGTAAGPSAAGHTHDPRRHALDRPATGDGRGPVDLLPTGRCHAVNDAAGCVQGLVAACSGRDDIAVGSPVANRARPETEALIGDFVNVVVLRDDVSREPSFREVLRRVKQTTLDAYDHQEMTLDQVVAAVNPPRDMSRHPLFQVMFALHNFDLPQMDPHGFNISGLEDGPAGQIGVLRSDAGLLADRRASAGNGTSAPTCSKQKPSGAWSATSTCFWPRPLPSPIARSRACRC